MKKQYSYSKRIHFATLCCFLFPFFYTGCGEPSAEEKAAKEKATQDSVAAVANAKTGIGATTDTTFKMEVSVTSEEELAKEKSEQTKDTTEQLVKPKQTETAKTSDQDKSTITPAEKICEQAPFLKSMLVPKENTYTGIAAVIDTGAYLFYFAIFLSFLLLILSLVIKFMEANARKAIVLLNTLALVALLVSIHFSGYSERLWGFWTALSFMILLTAYDVAIIIIEKKLKEKG